MSAPQKNDFNDAEAIAEAVQRPTMKFVATKIAEQLDLQALHRVRERLVKGPWGRPFPHVPQEQTLVRCSARPFRAKSGHPGYTTHSDRT